MEYYYRPSWVEISLNNLVNNVREIKRIVGQRTRILAIVKADGYGHGAIVVSQTLIDNGINFLGVALPEEGIVLRQAGINVPILVLGDLYPAKNFRVLAEYDLIATIASVTSADELIKLSQGQEIPVHIKIDTGMGRVGVSPQDAVTLIKKVVNSSLKLQGIYTHFASADSDSEYTLSQIQVFDNLVKELEKINIRVNCLHCANSAAILRFPQSYYDIVRPGLLLYGLLPYPEADKEINIKPVLGLKTEIMALKTVTPGKKISYGGTFVTKKKSVIATLPIGYADGYNRLLSNRGEVLVRGKRAPVVGRVTMDMTMVDISNIPGVDVGDEVILIGDQGTERITAEEIAEKVGTLNYEIVCALTKRLPRVYV